MANNQNELKTKRPIEPVTDQKKRKKGKIKAETITIELYKNEIGNSPPSLYDDGNKTIRRNRSQTGRKLQQVGNWNGVDRNKDEGSASTIR